MPAAGTLAEAVLEGDRVALAQAITLVESTRPEHRQVAEAVLSRCLSHTGSALRLGITGVPGVGKSTLIEALGLHVVEDGLRVAVLAVDPSSTRTGGSILGDKTRMARLAAHPDAFIRPSPAAGALGGVARRTREAMLLCEAAGFDLVIVETVGVGQSEVAVHALVDFFVLLGLAGAGDELQGIKRGIVEMADAIAITKADGDNRVAARRAAAQLRSALRLFSTGHAGVTTPVLTCSAVANEGIDRLWEAITDGIDRARRDGRFEARRRRQARHWLSDAVEAAVLGRFYEAAPVRHLFPDLAAEVEAGRLAVPTAVRRLLQSYDKDVHDGTSD